MSRTVHLSFGDVTGEEYARQLVADLLIHGWDLARAIGADETLDADLVDEVAAWFVGVGGRLPGRRCDRSAPGGIERR